MVAHEFIHEIGSTSFVLKTVGLSKSTFYYRPRSGQRGRQATTFSRHAAGHIVSNEEILAAVRWLLAQEFVDYGYVKVAVWLQRKGLIINRKKIYRLMRAEKLLLPKPSRDRSGKTWVKDLLPITQRAFDYLEFDIKYIQIDGTGRKAFLLTVIDVISRFNMGQLLQYSMKKEDVKVLFEDIFCRYSFPEKITVRSDNGSQFEAGIVRQLFKDLEVNHEFTRPGTPEQNAHIESYHSIVQRAVCDRICFDNLDPAQDTFERFRNFYNFERLHSGIGYGTPAEKLKSLGVDVPFPADLHKDVPLFFYQKFTEFQS